MKIHPAAKAFPLMEGDEFEEFVSDIEAHGLQQPIVLIDGAILDGRNRWRACDRIGTKPKTVTWKSKNGMSPAAYVASANLHRRHLTASQRAAVAAELMPQFRKAAKERQGTRTDLKHGAKTGTKPHKARDDAAAALGISHTYVDHAVEVKEKDPGLFKKVKAGKVTISAAIKKVKPQGGSRAAQDPGVKWAKGVHKTHELLFSVREAGGIKKTVSSWSDKSRRHYLKELKEFVAELSKWVSALED